MDDPESLEVRRQQRVEENNVCGIIKENLVSDGNKLKRTYRNNADPIGTAWKDKILFNGVIPAFSLKRATGGFPLG